ncbi:MAG TPA: branched-chain amino acid ABC transporter permease [Candidatus Dormibacteraeota bacterium]|nr:branched-chain amino acid ABC transporter permease [Candidatus Dormibacteraeota bacterium]
MSFSMVPTAEGRRLRRLLLVVSAVAIVLVLLAPLTTTDQADTLGLPVLVDRSQLRILTTIAMFVVLASAWNLVGGLTGYGSFGNVGFFGLGAYTCAVAVDAHRLHLPLAAGIALAPVVPALFAVLVGAPLLRLRGHYFAVATLGTAVAVGEVVKNIDYLGGATGLFPPIVRQADLLFLYLMVAAAVLAVVVTRLVMRSRFGYGLIAIRENEDAAQVIGVNTTAHKVAAFAIAAALSGLVGGVFALWNSFVDQSLGFSLDFNIQMILMAVLGGAGTLFGPVLGAVVLELLIQVLAGRADVAVYAQIGLGLLLAITVLFVPRGIVDFLGGSSKLSLAYLRRSLRDTGV